MSSKNTIVNWLYLCAFMVFAMAIIGAITRLTESGLSMVEWRPLLGAIPPLNEDEWQRVYELYKQSPEFSQKHNWMELIDFKRIFFWEWFHRLWGRAIGVVFTIPLIYFWATNKIPKGYKLKLFSLFLLGGSQGVLGWVMVMSGLVENPNVSHFRLAAHLILAMVILIALIWTARSIKTERPTKLCNSKLGAISLIALLTTITWGAFTAGLDAGLIYNSFPLMNGSLFPPESATNLSWWQLPLENQGWIQFTHRWLAISTGLLIIFYAWKNKSLLLPALVLVQIGLGITTLLTQVHLHVAVTHQAFAMILLWALVINIHKENRSN